MKKVKGVGVFLIFLLALTITPQTVFGAGVPYYTRTVDQRGLNFITKDGYVPQTVIEKFGELELQKPSDIAIAADGTMYIADTGNRRVIKTNVGGDYAVEIGVGVLNQPRGVFINANGELYVADPINQMVFLFDSNGELIMEYPRPQDALFGKSAEYRPSKVSADRAGNVYIISDGNTNGVIHLSRQGDFYGYVGANNTPLGITERFMRMIYTEEQLAQLKRNTPVSPVNIAIDSRGLIYTITQGGARDALKKVNIAGVNMLEETFVDELVTDVCISPIGNILTVSSDGYISEYTTDGELLFIFGGRDDGYNRDGLFVSASGIASDGEGKLYVLDTEQRSVTIFEPTEYSDTVHLALELHQKGQYLESRQPWLDTLRQDALLSRAHRGIGDSYYKLEMYQNAMSSYRVGLDRQGYSDSFWEIRNQWMMDNLATIFFIIIAFFVLVKIVKIAHSKTGFLTPVIAVKTKVGNVKLIQQLAFMGYIPKNPADAFYGIKFEGKVSIVSSIILYLMFFILYVLNKYMTGFLFKPVMDGFYEIGVDMAMVFGIIALSVISCNLICSISDGEGKARHMFCAFAYCLTPYIIIKPFVIILSHGLTYNESFIISFANFFAYAAIAVLVYVMVKDIQEYTYSKTFRILFLTVFTMLMLTVTGVIMFALINQVIDFVASVFREVYFRAG